MIGIGRLPAGRGKLADVRLLERQDQVAVDVAQDGDRRHVRLRMAVDEISPGVVQRDLVIRVFRRQQDLVRPVHRDAIEVGEIRVAPFLLSDSLKNQRPRLFIDPKQLRDVAFSGRDPVLQFAGCQVVQIELTPVVAL